MQRGRRGFCRPRGSPRLGARRTGESCQSLGREITCAARRQRTPGLHFPEVDLAGVKGVKMARQRNEKKSPTARTEKDGLQTSRRRTSANPPSAVQHDAQRSEYRDLTSAPGQNLPAKSRSNVDADEAYGQTQIPHRDDSGPRGAGGRAMPRPSSSHDAASQAERESKESPNVHKHEASPPEKDQSWAAPSAARGERSRESGSNDGGSQRGDDSGHGASSWRTDPKEAERNTWEDKNVKKRGK
jgi:hypothetical protein